MALSIDKGAWYLPGRPWLSLRRLVSLVYLRLKRKFGHDLSFDPPGKSSTPIDLFIPALEKDADMLEVALTAAKEKIWHPIKNIYIISPSTSARLQAIAKRHGAQFVAEDSIIPYKKERIDYQVGELNRNGWIYKMLINLAADTVAKSRYILVLDADTCFVAPQIFVHQGRPLFNLSNEYHQPYFDATERLTGLKHHLSRSFITHYMLFDAEVLKQLRHDIEERWQKPWYEAIVGSIDKTESSGFADYEIYGDYYLRSGKPKPILNYWSNESLTVDSFDELDTIIERVRPAFRSVSLHNYKIARTNKEKT
jgi:hypothetical protein